MTYSIAQVTISFLQVNRPGIVNSAFDAFVPEQTHDFFPFLHADRIDMIDMLRIFGFERSFYLFQRGKTMLVLHRAFASELIPTW